MKTVKRRRQFSPEFKQDAVKLAEKIGATAAAEKLGIHPNNLHKWKTKKNLPVEKSQDILRLQLEVKRLKKELAEEKAVVEFLKKATAFFSKETTK